MADRDLGSGLQVLVKLALGAAAVAARDGGAPAGHAARAGRAAARNPGPRAARPQPGAGAGRGHRQPAQRRGAARALPEPAGGGDGRRDGGPRPPRVPGRAAPADGGRGPHHQPVPARRPLPADHGQSRAKLGGARPHRAAPLQPARRRRRAASTRERVADVHRQPLPAGADRAAPGAHRPTTRACFRAAREPRPRSKAAIARIEARIPGARERAARRRRQSGGRRRPAQGAVRDRVRPPVLRGVRIPPRAAR